MGAAFALERKKPSLSCTTAPDQKRDMNTTFLERRKKCLSRSEASWIRLDHCSIARMLLEIQTEAAPIAMHTNDPIMFGMFDTVMFEAGGSIHGPDPMIGVKTAPSSPMVI